MMRKTIYLINGIYNSGKFKVPLYGYDFPKNLESTVHIKKYFHEQVNNENKHAHNILLSLPHYYKTTFDIQKLTSEASLLKQKEGKEVSNFIPSESEMGNVENNATQDKTFSQLIMSIKKSENIEKSLNSRISYFLTEKSLQLTDNELIELLLNLIVAYNYKHLHTKKHCPFNLLCKECIRRSRYWNKNQILLLADIWYALNVPSSTRYHCHIVKTLFAEPEVLIPSQYIQCSFYLNLIRKYDFDIQQSLFEYKFSEVMDSAGIEELSIIAMSFFKTKNIIKNIDILRKFVNTVIFHKENISDISLSSIFKLLRQSFNGLHPSHIELCSTLMKELKSEIGHMNHYSLLQLGSIGNHLNLYDKDLLNQIMEIISSKLSSLRLKDIERLSFIIMNSRTLEKYPDFCLIVEQELLKSSRNEEILHHFNAFLSCTYYLACLGHYNTHLISQALLLNDSSTAYKSKKSLIRKYTRLRHLYELDMMLHIEGPEKYEEYKLTKDYSKHLMKKFLPRFPSTSLLNPTFQERKFIELRKIMAKMFQEKFLKVDFILPSSTLPEIIFCTDVEGNVQPFPHDDFIYSAENVKYVLNSHNNLVWHAVVLVGQNCFLYNTANLKGSVALQIRLLEKIGYKVIMVQNNIFDAKLTEEKIAIQLLETFHPFINKKIRKLFYKTLAKDSL